MSKGRIAMLMVSFGLGVYFVASGIEGILNYNNAVEEERIAYEELALAEQDYGYEYGKCVFYDQVPVEQCNRVGPKGLGYYEKYYGDGSWTVDADPLPN